MSWSLYEKKEGKNKECLFLPPLVFSNNKSQEDVVQEIIKAIKGGDKVIFIKGVCGTGKSAVALNLAKQLGKISIVVPIKNLQKQYEDDYTKNKYVIKEDGEKLDIKVITGRINHKCLFLRENKELFKNMQEKENKKEKDTTLNIFDNNIFNLDNNEAYEKNKELSCDNPFIPCKIEIKEKNIKKIREYLKKNKRIRSSELIPINRVRRLSIAPICPYWSPIVPSEISLNVLEDAKKLNYDSIGGLKHTIYQRKKGCGYCDQYHAYLNSDVIIFNSQKYKLESVMNRKPATDLEIIDECDEFLDSFSNQEKINFNRLNFALGMLFPNDAKIQKILDELIKLTANILKDKKITEHILNEEIIPIKNTKIFSILQTFLNSSLMDYVECDEENYCYHIEKVAKIFKNFFEETFISFYKENREIIARLITTNLKERFKELLDKNNVLVLMSGTIHSEKVLKEIFGISDFKIIEAETKMPGKITEQRTGFEINCKYENFRTGRVSREQYLVALSKCIENAEKPALVHVVSFKDLPSEKEAENYNLNIMTREKLKKLQYKDILGEIIKRFKTRQVPVLYSTKCTRGVDFPGNICKSIVLTKYPYPDINSLFWRVLKRTRPQHYIDFYIDKSKREFLQRLYRGLRHKQDHIFLLSPDTRVFGR